MGRGTKLMVIAFGAMDIEKKEDVRMAFGKMDIGRGNGHRGE